MGESVVADFVGRFHSPAVEGADPVAGRILLSRKRLVLATDGAKTTIPLSSVIDLNVGTVPPEFSEFFDDTVTVAYSGADGTRTAVVQAGGENVGRFRTVLFKVLLGGETVIVTHPAKRGGRVTDAPDRRMQLELSTGELRVVGDAAPFAIDLSSVTGFERTTRTLGGKRRPALAVDHRPAGTTLTTVVALPTDRKLNLLGRYLRLEYAEVLERVAELDLTDEQVEILVSLYSAGGTAKLKHLVTGDATQVTMVLDSLRAKGLVADGDGHIRLTPTGRVAVTKHVEDVNV